MFQCSEKGKVVQTVLRIKEEKLGRTDCGLGQAAVRKGYWEDPQTFPLENHFTLEMSF